MFSLFTLCHLAATSPHKTVCDGRACRPGEGNAQGITHGSNPYDIRGGSLKLNPHEPDPASPLYAPLAAAANASFLAQRAAHGDEDFSAVFQG